LKDLLPKGQELVEEGLVLHAPTLA
jgi:hypothetical protein